MTALAALSAHGRHHRPPLRKRLLARAHRRPQWPGWLLNWAWHRQATPYHRPSVDIEIAQHDAHMVRVAAHAVPPLAQAQARMTALFGALHQEHAGFGQPPAAVLPDAVDERWPHLNRQWNDDTGTFTKISGDQS